MVETLEVLAVVVLYFGFAIGVGRFCGMSNEPEAVYLPVNTDSAD